MLPVLAQRSSEATEVWWHYSEHDDGSCRLWLHHQRLCYPESTSLSFSCLELLLTFYNYTCHKYDLTCCCHHFLSSSGSKAYFSISLNIKCISDYLYSLILINKVLHRNLLPAIRYYGRVLFVLSLSTLSSYRYLSDSGTNRREILRNGTYRSRPDLLPFLGAVPPGDAPNPKFWT